jgi:chorismate dehydratase
MAEGLRIGVVRYLNAVPLHRALSALAPEHRVEADYPSVLADRLARGDLDVAMIPSVEYLRGAADGRGYRIVPGVSIAARGPVRSVRLLARVPWARVRRLALDEGSRTSQALARVWLEGRHRVRPDVVEPLPLGVSPLESTADAVLIIGDRAMRDPAGDFIDHVDLGAAWNALTGLPFVFALWVAREGLHLGDLPGLLRTCRDRGLADVDAIAAEHGPRLGLTRAECVEYLTRNLSYELGDAELAGLRTFAGRARELGLIPGGANLVFTDRDLDPAARR